MNRVLLIIPLLVMMSTAVLAQEVSLIFGSLDGDEAGYIYAYDYTVVDVDVWIKTEPGIRIVGLHLPLSSKDIYIVGRIDGVFRNPLRNWETAEFMASNDDPENDGYTNQSIMAVCDDPVNAIETNGEWEKIAIFKMTAGSTGAYGAYYCNALIEGNHPDYGGITLADYDLGELDPSMYQTDFSCLNFNVNPCGFYIVGDYNGSGSFNVADVISAFSYLKTGQPHAALICECPPNSGIEWPVAMDLNNSCTFNIADICKAFGIPPWILEPCEHCPPR